jgi:2-octaprenyl-6-methoxyphenol hydroxylase
VSDRGHYGFARIQAKDYQISNVGSVVPIQKLMEVLSQSVRVNNNVEIIDSAQLQETTVKADHRVLTLKQTEKTVQLKCKLAIAADGTHSKLRNLLNIQAKSTHYRQSAIVANIGVERTHDGTAYERFTSTGPLAMLPISEKAFSLVWTLPPEQIESTLNLSDKDFLAELQTAFGYRLGRFSWVSERQSFPLSLLEADKLTAERAIIIGNAAHTLHPIAGQGFNLGLRDIAVLVDAIKNAIRMSQDIGGVQILREYEIARNQDMKAIINLTDKLVKIFSNNYWPHSLFRNLLLLGLDTATPLKNKLAYKTMGFIKNMPGLAISGC